jgi:hypothetical protein
VAIAVTTPGQIVTNFHGNDILETWGQSAAGTNVRYAYGWVEVDLQLDAWTTSDAARDELTEAIEGAIAVPPSITLGLTSHLQELKRRAGLVLRVPGLFNYPADYHIEGTGDAVEDDNVAHAAEWRSSWRGDVSLHLVTEDDCALLTQILLEMPTGNVSVP